MSQTIKELRVEMEKLKMVWGNALRKLERQMNKTNETPDTLVRSKKELVEKWDKLVDCQAKYLEQMTDDAEKDKEQDKFSELSEKHEDVMESADNKSKDGLANRDNTEVEARREEFQTKMGDIVVSKKSQGHFMKTLQEMKVENWSEKSQCKVVYGIEPKFYTEEFIGEDGKDGNPVKKGLFQIASELDDKTMASFRMMKGAGGMNDQLKTFSSNPEKSGNKIKGKFGMYSASKRATGANLIDVAYVVYDFEADLMGDASDEWMQVGVTDTSKTKESLMTRLKVGDIAALTENFILSKALTAFAQSNVIKRVNWEEEGGIEGGRLHEIDDKESKQNGN